MQYTLFLLAVIAYGAAISTFYLAVIRHAAGRAGRMRVARRLLWGAALLHLVDIVVRSLVEHACPVSTAQFGLSMAALVAVLTYLLWAKTEQQAALGVMIAPVGLALHTASVAFGGHPIHSRVPRWYLAAHVTCSLGGVGLFVIAAILSATYLIQSTRLKAKRAAPFARTFPGLSSLESIGHVFLGVGLGLMTLGVVSGAVFAERLSQSPAGTMRILLAYACWTTAAIVVIGQKVAGWHGRRVAWGTVVAAILAIGVVLLYALPMGDKP